MTHFKKVIYMTALLFGLAMGLCGCGSLTVTDASIEPLDTLTQGDSITLVTNYEFNKKGDAEKQEKAIENEQFAFYVEDKSVAIVRDGDTLSAVGGGTTTVTLKNASGTITNSITVTVLPRPQKFSIPESLTFTLGTDEPYQIVPVVEPESFDYSECVYSSSDENIVTVDANGVVTPVSEGTAEIYAELPSLSIKRVCRVSVYEKDITLSVSPNDIELSIGQNAYLSCKSTPNIENLHVTWTTTDESIATVTNTGKVTAIGPGIAFIQATTDNGIYAVCAVNVKEEKTAPSQNGPTKHNEWAQSNDTDVFDQLLDAINTCREQNGLQKLKKSSNLTETAAEKSKSLTDGNSMVTGYAELLAQNGSTAAEVAQAWYNNDYYQSIMLSSDYTACGVAIRYDGDGCSYWVCLLR